MSLKTLSIVTLAMLLTGSVLAQRNFDQYNRLGITAGLTFFDLSTSSFNTSQGSGVMGGFTTRGSFRNNFDLIYGLTFLSNKVKIAGSSTNGIGGGFERVNMTYSLQSVQVNFLGSYNIIKHHLSLEFGPLLNISSKLTLDSDQYQDYIVEGYERLRASEIEDISKVSPLLMGGLTAGLENFRLSAHYQYGLTNVLNNLNDLGLESTDFKGQTTTLILSATLYF
jgi:hypothetical protein